MKPRFLPWLLWGLGFLMLEFWALWFPQDWHEPLTWWTRRGIGRPLTGAAIASLLGWLVPHFYWPGWQFLGLGAGTLAGLVIGLVRHGQIQRTLRPSRDE